MNTPVNFGAGVSYDYLFTHNVPASYGSQRFPLICVARIHMKHSLRGRYYKVYWKNHYEVEFSPIYPGFKFRTHADALGFLLDRHKSSPYRVKLPEVLM